MKKRDDHSLGAEGYIPGEVLSRIKSTTLHVTTTFAFSDSMETMAKRFAVSFYKELRRYNFSEDQIVLFSTELLKILLGKLESFREKIYLHPEAVVEAPEHDTDI